MTLPLSDEHRKMLFQDSAVAPDVAEERGYLTVDRACALDVGFPDYQARPGLLIPIHGMGGNVVSYQLRPDRPRLDKKGRAIKYETRSGDRMYVDCHPRCRPWLGDPRKACWITEGVRKVDALISRGLFALALAGVHNFRGTVGGGKAVLPDFEHVVWTERAVFVCFDSDAHTNPAVCDAMARIGALLTLWGACVRYVRIPSRDGSKVGIDDYLAAGENLGDLIAAASEDPPRMPPRNVDVSAIDEHAEPRKVYPLTEVGNAQRLVDLFGEDVRWCQALGRWLVWDGRKWSIDEGSAGAVYRMAQEIVRRMVAEAAICADADYRKALLAHAMRSDNYRPLSNMVALAKTMPGVEVSVDRLDRDVSLFNLANGTIDLGTFELREHRRADFLTRGVDIPYDPDAEIDCPLWMVFLDTVLRGDEELLRYVWKACGYSLTGEVREKCFFFLHGHKGDNGKSVFVDTVSRILGPYAAATPTSTLIAKNGDGGVPNDLARLRGVRFVSASELGESKRLDEELIKQLTGRDTISARFMRGEWFDFMPSFKIWMTGNYKPIIRGQDPAIWNRPKLIPFTFSVPKEQQDDALPDKLWDERVGILAWMIEGCKAWRNERLGNPLKVAAATKEYREEMDDLGEFLRERTVEGESLTVGASAIYAAYETWTKINGMKALSSTSFGRRLAERGIEKRRTMAGNVYLGLCVVEDGQASQVYRGGE